MLKIALPNKGQLFKPTVDLLTDSGYSVEKNSGSLSFIDSENSIEFYFLRPNDIPMFVADGLIDAGITGLDFVAERNCQCSNILDLPFGHSKLYAAVPKESSHQQLEDLANLRIATSFTNIVGEYYSDHNPHLIKLDGAVEISVKLGLADAIVDIVETGTTLKQAGLRTIGDPLFTSNAALLAHPGREGASEVASLTKRVNGILVARNYRMIEYDVPEKELKAACKLTPGIKSPTVTQLYDPAWYSVKSMILKEEANNIMDSLVTMGCKGIVLTRIESARV